MLQIKSKNLLRSPEGCATYCHFEFRNTYYTSKSGLDSIMGVSQRFETHIDGMLSAIVCKYHLGIMKVYQGKICLHHFPNLYYTITLMSRVSLLIAILMLIEVKENVMKDGVKTYNNFE